MNIKEAKEQIKNAMTAYFSKDEFGYEIPPEKQRPVFLMGPPGIGKTAIMEQVAAEMGVGLISYSMTHHTRQSALGLPFIVHKNYGGYECDVSEYTMSEIISSVYDMMEETGIQEGILFLDEINCVSETLSPVMLQFLQYKVFGRHRVPDGWIVVTAGNPPEYNNSVREFDIVTWDRLKRIDVEPDFDVWKEYAYQKGVHPAVLTYLEIKKADFYKIESTVDGKRFVTARGWDDLSRMIQVYEKHDLKVDEKLVGQYLQNPKIAKDFAIYYDLFNKYRSDYQVDAILAGKASKSIKERAQAAKFDERLALLGLILDAVTGSLKEVMEEEAVAFDLMAILKQFRTNLTAHPTLSPAEQMGRMAEEQRKRLASSRKAGSLSAEEGRQKMQLIQALEHLEELLQRESNGAKAFQLAKADFDARVMALGDDAQAARKKLANVFRFCEEVFAEGQEMLILVTELTIHPHAAKFIARYGCPEYFAHNKELLFYERQQDIITELERLDLDDETE
ncbi:ATPase [Flavonifractor sp. An135]|nr:AAA family ATPase [Flavonifractor sp. An135]OUQ24337.1 ATPase [Flavonifractor sp. An135]